MGTKIQIDFDKMQGLVPAIIQSASDGEILMLGFMSREAWESTLGTGYVTFYSRTRNRLWTKGRTSGNRLKLISAATDCDCDTLLLRVEVEGEGMVCHEGARSCFTRTLGLKNESPRGESSTIRQVESPQNESLAKNAVPSEVLP